MKIVVCIKQVPGTSQVEIDPETGVLKRDGAAAKINPYDLYALETAMRLKERCGGTVTAVTMGPPQAEAMMKEAYMMGVDQAYVFTDRTFAGADVLATSYTLAQGITSISDFTNPCCTWDSKVLCHGRSYLSSVTVRSLLSTNDHVIITNGCNPLSQCTSAGKNEIAMSDHCGKRYLHSATSVLSPESSNEGSQS